MEELIQQAKDLVINLRDKLANVTKQSEELSTARNMVEAQKADQQTYAAELAGREVECRKVEDAQSLMANAKAMALDVQDDRAKLNGEIEKFDLEKKKISETTQNLVVAQELIDKGNILLREGNDKLKVDREKMKENILENLKHAKV